MYFIIRKKAVIIVIAVFILSICASICFYASPVQGDAEDIRLPVIMYHGLCTKKEKRGRYMIDPDCFEQDLIYLKNNGFQTILVSELVSHFENNTPLPEKPVLLTFDDGYLNNYTIAFPLLKKYNMKAVISPIAAEADKAENEKYRSDLWSQCKWEQLKEMADSGLVGIENHSYDLHKISDGKKGAAATPGESTDAYSSRLSCDLCLANDKIQQNTGKRPCAFVCPFGAISKDTETIVRNSGFSAMMDCEEKINHITGPDDLYHIHRFLRPDKLSAGEFFAGCLGQ